MLTFESGINSFVISRTNPIGMKGHMAKCYGDLVQELWSGTQKNIAPLKLRVSYSGLENKDFLEKKKFGALFPGVTCILAVWTLRVFPRRSQCSSDLVEFEVIKELCGMTQVVP